MGFFSKMTDFAAEKSISTIEKATRGKAGYSEVQMAFEMLASAGRLYKKEDSYHSNNDMRLYFWVNQRGELENIEKDTYGMGSSKFTKVRKSECANIDFRELFA